MEKEKMEGMWLLAIILAGFTGYILGEFQTESRNCEGIGGYIQNEINWEKQTINVIEANCGNNLFIKKEDNYTRLYCQNITCDEEGCDTKRQYLPLRVPNTQ